MFKIFIVILNWNRAEDTIECLKSIQELKIASHILRILVVDNASTDNSITKISNFKSQISNLEVIRNKTNLGYAAGNNIGINYAIKNKADYIILLNNDTVVDKDLLLEFLKASKKYPKAGILSPKIYFAKGFEFHKKLYKNDFLGGVIWYAGGEIDWKNVIGRNIGVDEIDKGQYNIEKEIDFATGACVLLNVRVLSKVGYFDENYFMYFEDADLSIRVKKMGWKAIYIPRAMLWHKVAQSSGIGSGLNDYFITRNRMIFGMKYAPARSKFALIRESFKLLIKGRKWQRIGIKDFYLRKFGKGSWQ